MRTGFSCVRGRAALLALFFCVVWSGGSAWAVPLVYTIDVPNSNLTSVLAAEFDISVSATLLGSGTSDWDGVGSITSERLDSNPVGTITADFGLPGWDDAAHFSDANFVTPNPGDANGSYSVEIGPCTSVFDFSVGIEEISVILEEDVIHSPLDPSETFPSPGPWTGTDLASLQVNALGGAHVSGNGLLSWVGFDLQQFSFGATAIPVPITIDLARRFNGGTEVGHDINIDIQDLALAFLPVPEERFQIDDCAYWDTADPYVCLVYMNYMDVQLVDYSLSITDIDGYIVAQSDVLIPVPQPSSLLLLGTGLAAVGAVPRRGRRG